MESKLFIHSNANAVTTISEVKRVHTELEAQSFLGIYAYATQSGAATFDIEMGETFWSGTESRWMLGIDYGRTHPQAVRSLLAKPNSQVRIHDGSWLVGRKGFLPRRDFHAKSAILMNVASGYSGVVSGSGNLSSNGLKRSIEAGATVVAHSEHFDQIGLTSKISIVEQLWSAATPAESIIQDYETEWKKSFSRAPTSTQIQPLQSVPPVFWIEAGYVTRNRGKSRPGNQIDFPRGMGNYFGLQYPDNIQKNSVIGELTFIPPIGAPVTNNLRLGNNLMEKVSLPTPETHGLDIYDGKVLVFQRTTNGFLLDALETADFESAFGDKLNDVNIMSSGRRFGLIS